jgi:hypothetical protein
MIDMGMEVEHIGSSSGNHCTDLEGWLRQTCSLSHLNSSQTSSCLSLGGLGQTNPQRSLTTQVGFASTLPPFSQRVLPFECSRALGIIVLDNI